MMLTRPRKRLSGGSRRAWSAAGLILAFLAAAPVLAEGPSRDPGKAVQEEAQPRETVFSLTVKGGWLMIPIGLCSIIVLTWTIERAISLRKSRLSSPGLLEELFAALPPRGRATKENVTEALAVCDGSRTIVSRVLRTGVERIHRDEAHAQSFLEESVAKEVHRLKWNLRPFEICVSVAPLLGLLGTIFGMISCFERTTYADTAARAETLANGIYVALVTTAAGLCVAIPALVICHYFLGRVDRAHDMMEEAATEFLDHYYGNSGATRNRNGGPASGLGLNGGPVPGGAGTVTNGT